MGAYEDFKNKLSSITEGVMHTQITGIGLEQIFTCGSDPRNNEDVNGELFGSSSTDRSLLNDIGGSLARDESTWRNFYKAALALPFTSYEITREGALFHGEGLTSHGGGTASLAAGARAFSNEIDFHTQSQELKDGFFESLLGHIFGMFGTRRTNVARPSYEPESNALTRDAILALFSWIFPFDYETFSENENDAILTAFSEYLIKPICRFLTILLGRDIKCNPQTRVTDGGLQVSLPDGAQSNMISRTDFSVRVKGRVVLVVEMKPYPIIIDRGNGPLEQAGRLLMQLLSLLISHRTRHGILSDGQNVILIKLTLDCEKNISVENGVPRVPVLFKVLNPQSSGLTMRAAMLAFIANAIEESEEMDMAKMDEFMTIIYDRVKMPKEEYEEKEIRKQEQLVQRVQNAMNAIGIPLRHVSLRLDDSATPIQAGDFLSQVILLSGTSKKALEEVISRKLPEKVVVKLFDPEKAEAAVRLYDHRSFLEDSAAYCVGLYLNERHIYESMQETAFSSCYIEQEVFTGQFEFDNKQWPGMAGPFLVMNFIESQVKPFPVKSAKHLEMARQQLSILHSMGIVHGDISRRNLLCTEDAVYIIDFALSSDDGSEMPASMKEDCRKLEEAFASDVI